MLKKNGKFITENHEKKFKLKQKLLIKKKKKITYYMKIYH